MSSYKVLNSSLPLNVWLYIVKSISVHVMYFLCPNLNAIVTFKSILKLNTQ
jgi:hypothetical protein